MAKSKTRTKSRRKPSVKPIEKTTARKLARRPTARPRPKVVLKLPAFDPTTAPERRGTNYPPPFAQRVGGRVKRRLGDAAGLTQFGVNLVTLPPGCESSMRHWHAHEDELVYVLSGALVLVTDRGEQVLTAGMAAGFPAGKPDGHHLINRTKRPATYLEVGTRWPGGDEADYSDIDMLVRIIDGVERYVHKDGTPY